MTRAFMIVPALVAVARGRRRPGRGPGAGLGACTETASDGGGAINCGFHNFAQCLASRPGGSSHCVPNPGVAANRSSKPTAARPAAASGADNERPRGVEPRTLIGMSAKARRTAMTGALMMALAYVAVLARRHRSRRGPGAGVVPLHQRPAHELRLLHLRAVPGVAGCGLQPLRPEPGLHGGPFVHRRQPDGRPRTAPVEISATCERVTTANVTNREKCLERCHDQRHHDRADVCCSARSRHRTRRRPGATVVLLRYVEHSVAARSIAASIASSSARRRGPAAPAIAFRIRPLPGLAFHRWPRDDASRAAQIARSEGPAKLQNRPVIAT